MKIKAYFRRCIVLCVVLLLAGTITASATSLYPIDKPSLYEDQKARRPGDLVTVIIVEQAQARQNANTAAGKNSDVSVGPGMGVLSDLIPLFKLGGGDTYRSDGVTTRGGSLTAKLTTQVVESLPNGVLRIEGRQKIVINGEEQEIVISGLVRSRDVAPDNTVLSTFVADAEIAFVGSGIVADKNNPGILTRLFNWLF
ncbi:MAG: flagellar basal body L-ring protein FlgH [Firmicutes bacterium]|jgi:flagellar L-ring protein precursor FlgH|nr:flagellar basal body L-ring protein FlgH [Bacillota bacterium]NLO66854.1 flagellar basal body L-ring protein FlgH [Bacillota bacterium]